jgi:PAS domain S-box-containing protein
MQIINKMSSQNKTKDELIDDLVKLRQGYDSIKVSYEREIANYEQTKDTLQKSEEKWRKLVSAIPDYIALHDLNGKYIFLNHYAEGFSEKDVVGKSVYNFISEDSKEEFRRNFEACLQTNQNQRFIYTAFGNNKILRMYQNILIPILDKGQIVSVMAVATDITERIKVETTLKESEIRFRSLFENSLLGISTTDPDGNLLQVNHSYARMYGYENPEVMLKEVTDVGKLYANPKEREEVLRILKRDSFIESMEVKVMRRDRSQFSVLVSASEIRNAEGKVIFNQATHLDLTELRKTEDEVRKASLYTRNLIEASLDPLVTINSEGKITDVNLSTEEITGVPREKLIGSDFADYFEDPGRARNGYKIVFSKGVVKDYPLTILHKSGRKIDVLYNATLYKNEAGEVEGVFAAARDITDRNKMEVELRNSKELLERLNQHLLEVRENERNQIALNLHDDLGQKLTAINLDIAWLKRRIGVQSKTVQEKFEEMTCMIKETIESLKETSSLLRPAILFDLGLVSAIKSQLAYFEKQTGIKCHFYYEPEEFKLSDRLSLIFYRILQESLTNIARHSCASKTDVDLHILNNKVEMLIEDNGTGIEKSKVNSFRSMGLAGMKERVKSAHGNITISGERGSGTRIKVLIPLKVSNIHD